MVNPLLNYPLVRRVIWIQHLDSLPSALALPQIITLERKTGNQHCQRQALRVHTRLHQLLLAGEVRISRDEAEGDGHGGYPGAHDDWVSLLGNPLLRLLACGALCILRRLFDLGHVLVAVVGVTLLLECTGVSVGGDDSFEERKLAV